MEMLCLADPFSPGRVRVCAGFCRTYQCFNAERKRRGSGVVAQITDGVNREPDRV